MLKKAPKNEQMTSNNIQKDIACKLETMKVIMEDLNGDHFSLLVMNLVIYQVWSK